MKIIKKKQIILLMKGNYSFKFNFIFILKNLKKLKK